MKLSILIKAYNEERKIERCLQAALEASVGLDVEIIVADSLSTDRTVLLASRYPVKVVQLQFPEDRGCGSGVQLGFQYASGEFVYLLDGDMELQRDFLRRALEYIEADPSLAGVSGLLLDQKITNRFDHYREKNKPGARAGEVEWLAGGGLYRRAAILAAGGYAGNRNLKAYEEAELGLRLRSIGWRMVRLPQVAVLHTGHADSTIGLIARQWRSGRMNASGVLLKSALGRSWLRRVVRMCIHPLGVLLYWPLLLLSMLLPLPFSVLWGVMGGAIFVALVAKKRSFLDAAFSLLLWHVSAAGLLRGMLTTRVISPVAPISSRILTEGGAQCDSRTEF